MAIKVVLVDNEKSSLAKLKEIVSKAGFEVATVNGAFAALNHVSRNKSHILIALDDLEDLDGYRLSCLIKTNHETCRLPVIIVKQSDNGRFDSFWVAAGCNLVIGLEAIQDGNLVVSSIEKLTEGHEEYGGFCLPVDYNSTSSSSGPKTVENLRMLADSLLLEHVIRFTAHSLLEPTSLRNKFINDYFTATTKLFPCQALGIVRINTQTPWASFQVTEGVSKASLTDLVTKIAKEFNNGNAISLEVHGNKEDSNQRKLNAPEILVVSQDKIPLGALVFSPLEQNGFTQTQKAAMSNLKEQLVPVMKMAQAAEELSVLHQKEGYRASTDPLTGLYNLEFLVGFLQQQLLFSYRQRSPVGVAIIDIDHLQSVNEQYGYEIGDLVLSTIANHLLNQTRSSDLTARYGGDEFAVVLPNTDGNGTKVLAEKIRLDIEQMNFMQGAKRKGPRVTVSIGCAAFNLEDLNPETILRDAKLALKRAKELGSNRVSL